MMRKAIPVLFVLLAALAVSVRGATWYLSANSGDDGNNGSESEPFRTLERAVDAASEGDTLVLMPGVYSGPDNKVEIDFSLTLMASEAREAVLSWTDNDDDDWWVVYAEDDAEVSFIGLKFVAAPTAIVFDEAQGTVDQCEFQYCDYGVEGYDLEGTIRISNSFFEHTTGTAVDVYGDDDGDLIISSTTFANSDADDVISVDDLDRLSLRSVVFYRNRVYDVVESYSVGEVGIVSCMFAENTGDDALVLIEETDAVSMHDSVWRSNHVDDQGGAFRLWDVEFLRATNLTVTQNTSPSAGGGVALFNTVGLMDQCSFTNNTVSTLEEDGGGALCLFDESRLLVSNSVLTNNRGGPFGGAAMVEDSFLELDACKVTGNAAVVGGAFQCADDGRVRVSDTTMENNESYSGNEGDCSL